jgi:hypothetical protein
MRRALVWLLAAVVATAALVVVGVVVLGKAGGSGDEPAPEPTFSTTALDAFDTAALRVVRGPFCDRLDPRQVAAAVDGDPADSVKWDSGNRVTLDTGPRDDVVHEFGCQYVGADATTARAWSFAPQVGAETAAKLVKSAARARGCTPGPQTSFGSPTLALTCTNATDSTTTASYRGLFGDTWVVCEVRRPAGAQWDVADRAGRWCVGALLAMDAG